MCDVTPAYFSTLIFSFFWPSQLPPYSPDTLFPECPKLLLSAGRLYMLFPPLGQSSLDSLVLILGHVTSQTLLPISIAQGAQKYPNIQTSPHASSIRISGGNSQAKAFFFKKLSRQFQCVGNLENQFLA